MVNTILFVPTRICQAIPAAALIACSSLATGTVLGQGGFYFGVEVGPNSAGELESTVDGVNHPTRCDRLLYANPGDAPTDAACTDNQARSLLVNTFDGEIGFAAVFSLGYAWGNVRLEGEYAQRYRPGMTAPFQGAGGNAALSSKDSEWNELDLPSETISNLRFRQLFMNAFYDFAGESRWTPFVGIGAGVVQSRIGYGNRFVRKPELGNEDWQNAAEGTLSFLDATVEGFTLGYQAMAGFGYAIADQVSFTARVRWSRSHAVHEEDLRWTLIRSHEPVQADGRTPFETDVEFGPSSWIGLTLGLRVRHP